MNDGLNIKTSSEIKELISALAKVQGELRPAVFNKVNPHYKTRYADFTSCMDACRDPLSKNGLAIIQTPQTINGHPVLVTMLAHESGQWLTGEFPLIAARQDSQGLGSAMTYAKRYSLCGILGIVADDDDDGNSAIGKPAPVEDDKITVEQADVLIAVMTECDDEFRGKCMMRLKSICPTAKSFYDVPPASYKKIMELAQKRAYELKDQKVAACE
jgi:hypothetical protein